MKKSDIFMIGAFPPPIHGMAVINLAVLNQLRSNGVNPVYLDVSSGKLDQRLLARLSRIPKVLSAVYYLATMHNLCGAKLYMSISAGFGQIYEILLAWMARVRGMKLFFHHHSFSYLKKYNRLTSILIRAAGSPSIHIVLSNKMAQRMTNIYNVTNIVSISNAVFSYNQGFSSGGLYRKLRTIGFIGNISPQKGIYDFLNLMKNIEEANLPLKALVAGPFLNSYVEKILLTQISRVNCLHYVGEKFGAEKDRFFKLIDILIFPSHENEAEPLVILEAMNHGIPVISYDRGCIPEIIDRNCGKIIDKNEDFVQKSYEQITFWLNNPVQFNDASKASTHRLSEIYIQNRPRWNDLLNDLIYESPCDL